jgi:hypothetical protein
LFQPLLDPLFPGPLAITSPTERASLPGLHKLDAFAIVRRLSPGHSHMRWFRSHRTHIAWLAYIALTCDLVLSFGHIHVGKAVGSFGIASFLVSQGATGNPPGNAPHKNRPDLADEDCAICVSIRLASTLIGLSLPTVEAPGFIFKSLTWPAPNAGSVRFAQFRVRARGPPYSIRFHPVRVLAAVTRSAHARAMC